MNAVKNIVILISGLGSNMQAIVRACQTQAWNARIAAVVSNRADAPGLAFAQQHGLVTAVVDHQRFETRASFDAELARTVAAFAPDVVVLAGFMRILGDAFVGQFAGRMVNVHPSLLPAFTGLHTHRRALEAGCKLAGATVHFVTPELDFGPIIAQAAVPVLAGDTPQTLAARVLEAEHLMYPCAVRWLIDGRLSVDAASGVVTHVEAQPQVWWPEPAPASVLAPVPAVTPTGS